MGESIMQEAIQTGSKELTRERLLVRSIIRALALKLRKSEYLFRRSEEQFGGHQGGYKVEYTLIGCKPKDRIAKSFKLRFSTCGASWDHRNDPDRVVVNVWGRISSVIKHPREEYIERLIHGAECTFNRNRPLNVQVSTVIRLIEQQRAEYDKMLVRIEGSMADWDRFAQLFDRVKKTLNIPATQVWRPHANHTTVELGIPPTKRRDISAKLEINMNGDLDLIIRNLTEQKLQRIVQIIRS